MNPREGLGQWQAAASQAANLDYAFRSIVLGDTRGQNATGDKSSRGTGTAVIASRIPPHMRQGRSVWKPRHLGQQAQAISPVSPEAPSSARLQEMSLQASRNTIFHNVDSTQSGTGNLESNLKVQDERSTAIPKPDVFDVEPGTEQELSSDVAVKATQVIWHDEDTKSISNRNGAVMTTVETPLALNKGNLSHIAPLTPLHPGKVKGNYSQLSVVSFSRLESPTGPPGLSRNVHNSLTMVHKSHNIGGSLTHSGRGNQEGDDVLFVSQAFLKPYIDNWSSGHPDQFPIATFNHQLHELRDVDTHTGKLLDGVIQPPTYPHPDDARVGGDGNGEEHHLKGTTSSSLIAREIRIRESWTKKMMEVKMTAKTEPAAVRPLVEERPPTPRSTEKRSPYKVKVECDLRPARISDMDGVLQIYNNEIKHGIQTVDTKLLTLADMKSVFEGCNKDHRPFIVVVKRELKFDPKCWPSEEIFMEYMRMKKAQPGAKEGKVKVLGFGLLTEYQAGLAGAWHGSGRYTARVHVYVDPHFRRKKLGTAILDRLLCLTSHNYVSKNGYDWVCPEDLDTYISRASLNTRVFRRLLIETKMLEKDPNFNWMKRFLQDTFCFWQMSKGTEILDDLHRTQRGCDSVWHDAILWQHDAWARDDMPAEKVHGVPSQWK